MNVGSVEWWIGMLADGARAMTSLAEALDAIATRAPVARRVHDVLAERSASAAAAEALRTGELEERP